MRTTFFAWVSLVLVVFGGTGVSSPAAAQERPDRGHVFNAEGNEALAFRCVPVDQTIIECEFAQTMVTKMAKPEDLPEVLRKARESFPHEKKLSPEDCKKFAEAGELIDDVLAGRKVPPKADAVSKIDPRERVAMRAQMAASLKLCAEWSEVNYLAAVSLLHERECETCTISTHTFNLRMRRQYAGVGVPKWVTVAEPAGPCGVISVDRFEADETTSTRKWNYFSRKIATIKTGKQFGRPCAEYDETEEAFNWLWPDANRRDCTYLKFSPI